MLDVINPSILVSPMLARFFPTGHTEVNRFGFTGIEIYENEQPVFFFLSGWSQSVGGKMGKMAGNDGWITLLELVFESFKKTRSRIGGGRYLLRRAG